METAAPPAQLPPPGAVLRRLLQGLSDEQRLAVENQARALCVVAGAGSGKTRVLTHRVARRIVDGSARSEHVVVVTFTRRAADELRRRLWQLGVRDRPRVGTIHATAYSELRRAWADQGRQPPTLIADCRHLLAGLPHVPAEPAGVTTAASELSWTRALRLAPADYPAAAERAGRRPLFSPPQLVELAEAYRIVKRRKGVIDLDDVLEQAAHLVEGDPTMAAATRWRIRHLFVDELQDVNQAQWRLLAAWMGPSPDLFVVGDPRQAVYGWNGADPRLLQLLPELVPDLQVLELSHNHRCTPQVLAAATTALVGQPLAAPVPLRSPVAQQPDGPAPEIEGFEDEQSEAEAVARWLRRAHRPGRRWRQLAVLARTNARLHAVAEALARGGIPFRLGGLRPQGDIDEALTWLGTQPPAMAVRSALADLSHQGQLEAARDLARLADELAEDEPDPSVGSFLSWFAAAIGRLESLGGVVPDAVELASFHRAKGLEWEAVALVGLERGLVPFASRSAERQAEERRLLYVAMTRAAHDLRCSWAASRRQGDHVVRSEPSPLLEGIANACRRTPSTAGQVHLQIAELRRRLEGACS